MRRSIRFLMIGTIVLLALLVSIPFFLDASQFRPAIETKLSSVLGREVKIGKVGLAFLSGSLSADDLSIADDPSYSKNPFLTAHSIRIGVELKPLLLSKTVRITRIVIEKPDVTLLRGPDGKWNFSSLAATAEANPSGSQGPAPGAAVDTFVRRLELVDGRLSIGNWGSTGRTVYENVRLEADDISLSSQFHLHLAAALPQGGTLNLEGTAGPIKREDAALTPLEAKLSIDALRLAETGFIDPASGISGVMDFRGNITSNRGQAHARGDAKLNRLQVVRGGTPAAVPVEISFDGVYDLAKRASALKAGTLKAGAAVLNLTGTTRTAGEITHLDLTLAGQGVLVRDLQALLPAAGVTLPRGASLSRGTMNVKLGVTGPTDRIVTAGDIGLFDAELAGFDLGSKMSALSSFAGVKGEGGKTFLQKLATSVRVSPEGIRAADLDMIVPAIGELRGNGTIAPDTAMDFKMSATLASSGAIGGALGRLTGRTGKDTRIPFLVRGRTSDPKFLPDVGGMMQEALPSDLGSALKGLFSKSKKN